MRREVRNIVLVVIAIPIIVVVALLLFAEWAWGGRVQTSLDAQYVPTAQYLMQNPEPTPRFLRIDPLPGSVIHAGERIDVGVNPYRLSLPAMDIWEWTRFYINTVRVDNLADLDSMMGGPLMPEDETFEPYYYLSPQLQPGLHLIEIRVGTSIVALLNPAEAHSYTWAYRVE